MWVTRPRRAAATAFCAALTVGLLSGCTGAKGSIYTDVTPTGTVIPVPDRKPAGAMTGDLIGGGTYALRRDAGEPVVLNWFASWCSPCQAETPALAAYYPSIKTTAAFVGIDSKDAKSAGTSFVKDSRITYPVVYDFPLHTVLQLGRNVPVSSLPFTVIVDRHQKVAAYYLGPVQPADLQHALDALKAEH